MSSERRGRARSDLEHLSPDALIGQEARQKLDALSKQGKQWLHSLPEEATQIAVQYDPGLGRQYLHHCHRRP
jgi:hypothetical protein